MGQISIETERIITIARKYVSKEFIEEFISLGASIYDLRKEISEHFVEAFIEYYFPNEFTYEIPDIHRVFIIDIELLRIKQLYKEPGLKLVRAIPRGHAKSTYYSRILPLHGFLYGWSKLTVLLGNNATSAVRLLKNIRDVLETNEIIKQDFGDIKGDIWQANTLQSSSNAVIKCFGMGSGAIRGVSSPGLRPSLIIGDDLDDDQSVRSSIQLESNKEWFDKAVMALGDQVLFTTSYVVVGTIISTTSLLQHILNANDFHSIIEQGIIDFSNETALWDEWRDWYIQKSKANRKPTKASEDIFYTEHKERLLAGTRVLWDRPDAYYHIMVYRLSRGEKSFFSEIQNQPQLYGGKLGTITVKNIIDYNDWERIAALDPTIKGGKLNDLSAFVEAWFNGQTKEVIISYIDAQQRPYGQTIDDVVKRVKNHRYSALFCESNNSGEMMADAINEKLDTAGIYQTFVKINNSANKDDRIGMLSVYAQRQQLFISNDLDEEFMNEWNGYPGYRFDDVLDATATIVLQLHKAGYLDI